MRPVHVRVARHRVDEEASDCSAADEALREGRARVRVESQHEVEHGHEEPAAADATGSGKRAYHEDQRGGRILTEDYSWPERLVRASPAVCAMVAVRKTLE